MTVGRIPSVEGGIQPTIFDAKADLLTATAADTPARLAVGSNNQVLTADSSTATGLKWVTPASGSTFSGALATISSSPTGTQSIPNNTNTIVNFNSETGGYDTDSYHDNTTNNSRMTIPSGKTGYYWVWVNVTFAPNATGRRICRVLKNGSVGFIGEATPNATANVEPTIIIGKAFYATAGDYFEIDVYQTSGGNLDIYGGQTYNTQLGIYYIGA